jgi:hypothetical protein
VETPAVINSGSGLDRTHGTYTIPATVPSWRHSPVQRQLVDAVFCRGEAAMPHLAVRPWPRATVPSETRRVARPNFLRQCSAFLADPTSAPDHSEDSS